MSYIVTARKWRPQLFQEVIGQRHVTGTLQNAIKTNQVGHAYLFSGPRGVGKTTVARIFAKALNCEHGPAEEPCNTCPICTSIQSGMSMDIQELDGASNNSVEDVRNLITYIGYHTSECRYKMYIIDEVHMLSKEAFNALLKTLEEPPSNVIFVFATTEPQKIIPTVLSRCQRYDFRRLSVHDIAAKLMKITEKDGIEIDEASIFLIARRATGAMRDAESILEQLKSSRGSRISVGDVNEVLGVADREVFFGIMDRCHEGDVRDVVGLFNRYYDEGGDVREFVEGLLGHLRDMLYARFGGGLDQVILPDDLKKRLVEQTSWYEYLDIVRMVGYIVDVESSLAYAVMPLLRIEVALTKMASMETTVQLRDLLERLGAPETELAQSAGTAGSPKDLSDVPESSPGKGAQKRAHEKVPAPPEGRTEDTREEFLNVAPDLQSIRDSWDAIAARVGTVKPHIGPSLTKASPRSFDNDRLVLGVSAEDMFHQKALESSSGQIAEIIGAMVGKTITLDVVVKREKKAKKPNGEEDDLVSREPIIGTILDMFDGEIKKSWRE